MLARCLTLSLVSWMLCCCSASAQAVRPAVPYDGQLRTDPDVGNVQGIQRYGRPLKTDPDQGEGFSYHVYPVADRPRLISEELPLPPPKRLPNAPANNGAPFQTQGASTPRVNGSSPSPADMRTELDEINQLIERNQTSHELTQDELAKKQARKLDLMAALAPAGGPGQLPAPQQQYAAQPQSETMYFQPSSGNPYPPAFDWTEGIRNFPRPGVVAGTTPVPVPLGGYGTGDTNEVLQAISISRTIGAGGAPVYATQEIYHQPLIQVKMRVVEVERGDSLEAGSILEYVSRHNNVPTLTSGQTANTLGQNARAISRLALPDLATSAAAGTGSLVNITSEHINLLIQLLATEAKADIVTAPEVVTLDGQNVEFVAGAKVPFQLGQNVIQGTNNNIQQFFYKHVGTMVSVTPRIVNWGYYGEGQGERPVMAHDVIDWPELVHWLAGQNLSSKSATARSVIDRLNKDYNPQMEPYLVPFSDQTVLLQALNDYSRGDLQNLKTTLVGEKIISCPECDRCRKWKPEDCTIDLTVVVRLSEANSKKVEDTDLTETTEDNVRAVSNVIQVKSGNGVVMAGLIGDRETQELAKVPVLGDVPVLGFFFRNKVVIRQKTEVLIFVEAQVLDPDPCVARGESANDFALSQPFVAGNLLDNPLENGFWRVGFGTYLPPHMCGEDVYWERFGRDVRDCCTHADDILK